MAFNQAQLDELNKIEGFEKNYSKGATAGAKALGDVAFILIPGGTVIRAGRAGSKLFATIRKRLKKAFGNVKVIKKPSATQIKNAKPPSSVLKADGSPKANVKLKPPEQVAINRLSGQGAKKAEQVKPKIRVPAATKAAKSRKDYRQPPAPKPKGNVKSTRKLAEDVKAAAAKRAAQARMRQAQKRKATVKKAAGAGAVAAGVTGAAIGVQKATSPKKAGATTPNTKKISPKGRPGATTPNTKKMPASGRRKPTGTYDRRAVPTGKPKRKPTGTYDRSPVETRKPKRGVGGSTPSDAQKRRQVPKSTSTMSDAQKRRATRITAGPNVGFGPKGNIFPKNAADRQRLMKKYGGTGSAAARAAAQGKQGNLKKGSK